MGKQKVTPIAGWDEAASCLEAWYVFSTVFLRNESKHPANFDMFLLINETSIVSPRLRVQAR